MSMRTNYEFRRSLVRSMQVADSKPTMRSMVANCILGELDDVMVRAWSHVQDAGMPAGEFAKIKRLIKKRL